MPRLQFVGHQLSGHSDRSSPTCPPAHPGSNPGTDASPRVLNATSASLSRRALAPQVTASPAPGIAPSAIIAHGFKRGTVTFQCNGAEDPGHQL